MVRVCKALPSYIVEIVLHYTVLVWWWCCGDLLFSSGKNHSFSCAPENLLLASMDSSPSNSSFLLRKSYLNSDAIGDFSTTSIAGSIQVCFIHCFMHSILLVCLFFFSLSFVVYPFCFCIFQHCFSNICFILYWTTCVHHCATPFQSKLLY